jgi:hypothetical protein
VDLDAEGIAVDARWHIGEMPTHEEGIVWREGPFVKDMEGCFKLNGARRHQDQFAFLRVGREKPLAVYHRQLDRFLLRGPGLAVVAQEGKPTQCRACLKKSSAELIGNLGCLLRLFFVFHIKTPFDCQKLTQTSRCVMLGRSTTPADFPIISRPPEHSQVTVRDNRFGCFCKKCIRQSRTIAPRILPMNISRQGAFESGLLRFRPCCNSRQMVFHQPVIDTTLQYNETHSIAWVCCFAVGKCLI